MVQAGQQSAESARNYLAKFYQGRPVVGFKGKPEINGVFHYTEDKSALNFEAVRVNLLSFIDKMLGIEPELQGSSFYVGSTDLDVFLPGLSDTHQILPENKLFKRHKPVSSIWIGNQTTASAHYDLSNNIACCVAGRRRFTLFPPNQIENLYPGPLELTPAGQVVSMVDFRNPDLRQHPKFKKAKAAAQVAEMEPGDILVYPAMWWHQVEALDPFNILINFWWNETPDYFDTPMLTLQHAFLSLRSRPDHEKRAWKELFEYYIFSDLENASAHIPDTAKGILGPIDAQKARRLRASLLSRLNR